MAIYKCKMCGGDLEIADGVSVAECEYCGTKQTVPRSMDENLQSTFNRANTLRLKCEFDKAEALYEKIVRADETQSDAYWGIILCKNGIEYVDDPATLRKIPTCHRASVESIVADDNYKLALQHADASQRAIYEEQAREIDRIQREIVALAQKEETYDVFICYKQSDSEGKRTQDSVIANDIYYQLTQEGFKVFYAAITLEGKLGSAYEPIIFAALNSAKVMLVIGTRPEYFNAVWVKNEWSRFLKIIKADRSKLLIPCYRDMDAYDLPEEFAHLQAQDMSKIGFINDVVRGIGKVIKKDEPKANHYGHSGSEQHTASIDPLIRRVFMFIDDDAWESADEYCEKVLDIDPENVQAYLGKLFIDLRVKKLEELETSFVSFANNKNYQKLMMFGDEALKARLKEYSEKSAMIDLAFSALANGDFKTADDHFSRIIAKVPNMVSANLGKLLVDLRLTSPEALADYNQPFSGNQYYIRLMAVADSELKQKLGDYSNKAEKAYMMNRAGGLLLEKKYAQAEMAFSEIINRDASDADAHLGRLMASLQVSNADELFALGKKAGDNPNYKVFLHYAELSYNDKLKDFAHRLEENVNAGNKVIYDKAVKLLKTFRSDFYDSDYRIRSLKYAITQFNKIPEYADVPEKIKETQQLINDIEASKKGSGGCYVATCVYGSYDCPEVWTLRRFRDDTLGSSWYGRLFIRVYYAVSPTLVKWFGDTKWFKKMWRGPIDRMVRSLQNKGVESTPYKDKNWK